MTIQRSADAFEAVCWSITRGTCIVICLMLTHAYATGLVDDALAAGAHDFGKPVAVLFFVVLTVTAMYGATLVVGLAVRLLQVLGFTTRPFVGHGADTIEG